MRGVFLIPFLVWTVPVSAQYTLHSGSTPTVEENFDGFAGAGFVPGGGAGQLDSNQWIARGFSTHPAVDFGDLADSGDLARGLSPGGVGGGGIYAFDVGGNIVLGAQASGADMNPGDVAMQLENTGPAISAVRVAFDFWTHNDTDRARSVRVCLSVPSRGRRQCHRIAHSSLIEADVVAPWRSVRLSQLLTFQTVGGDWSTGERAVIEFEQADAGGGGSRDETGIDDVRVDVVATPYPTGVLDPTFADYGFGASRYTPVRVAANGAGFVVLYGDAGELRLTFLDLNGAVRFTRTITTPSSFEYDVTANAGGFLVSYISSSAASIGQAVFARYVTNTGLVGAERLIGDHTVTSAEEPCPTERQSIFAVDSVSNSAGRFLVVWEDGRNWCRGLDPNSNHGDVYGALLNPTGGIVLADIDMVRQFNEQYRPTVASVGTQFLVVWRDRRVPARYTAFGMRVSGAGALLDGPVASGGVRLDAGSEGPYAVHVGATSSHYHVRWMTVSGEVRGARVATTGAVDERTVLSEERVSWDPGDHPGGGGAPEPPWGYNPVTASDGDDVLTLWRDDRAPIVGHLSGARRNASGGFFPYPKLSDEFRLDGDRGGMSLVSAPGGRWLLATMNSVDATNYRLTYHLFADEGAGPGEACGTDADCDLGHCVGGICCARACSECETCRATEGAPRDGECGHFASSVAPGQVCRPASGACDVEEYCRAESPRCPPDDLSPIDSTCRTVAGECDAPEACTGLSRACPVDGFSSGVVCRPAAGPCDRREVCAGDAPTCPTDRFHGASRECRGSEGVCDPEETCTGFSAACPPDARAGGETVCRVAAGVCDAPEVCGGDVDCPADAPVLAGATCRESTGPCDPAETCDGVALGCGPDVLAADGTSCGDESLCNGAETCGGGTCRAGTPLVCDDGDVCTVGRCDPSGGCAFDPIESCCRSDLDCDDADPCTRDRCDASSVCENMAIPGCDARPDAGTPEDAGAPDAEVAIDASSTPDAGLEFVEGGDELTRTECGCRAPGAGGGPAPVTWAFLAVVSLALLRRRRA